VLNLSGTWKLALDKKNVGREEGWFKGMRPEAKEAPVPGIIQQVFPDCHGVVWYWREFQPARRAESNERYLLKFGAVDYLADVWVNGKHIGGHEGGETPFILDATDAIQAGKSNLVAVRVLNPTDAPIDGIKLSEIPHRNKEVQGYMPGRSYNSGGIVGPVELAVVPAVRVTDVFARPNVKTGEIRVTITVRNDTSATVAGTLTAKVGPASGGEILTTATIDGMFQPGDSEHEVRLGIDQPHLWNLNDPYLYRVTAKLSSKDTKFAHEEMVRCGFRELRGEKGYFRLNGKRIFLKSTHTGNHFPIGQVTPMDPDLMRRDFLMAKVAGYNCVRFIAGMGWSEQMDFCDEIGLMVYEECLAGWCLEDSPDMKRRFELSVREMILRDRNHPSIAMWGLLNETGDGPVFRQAVDTLKLVRSLDDTRLVLLSSGRWDGHPEIGSVSNPGSDTWEHEWGPEAPNAKGEPNAGDPNHGGYFRFAGDAHVYPGCPHPPVTLDFLRNLGKNTKPVFLSEYGTGSMLDVIRGTRWYEQIKARPDLSDVTLFRTMAEKLEGDWKKWGFEGTYAFTQDLLRDSQRLHTRQRLLGFDLIRSNPKICGFNLTGILDHGITGEGVWTFFREWKPGTAEALADGWAPVRWCLFVDPMHGYAGRKFKVEAVLANEDVLGPGEYPCTFRVHGKAGTVWEKKATLRIPKPKAGEENPLAFPVLCEEIKLKVPAGEYEFTAYMERGGAPFGGRLKFHVTDPAGMPKSKSTIQVWGVDKSVEKWLTKQGIKCKPLSRSTPKKGEVILVGDSPSLNSDANGWMNVARQLAQGGSAVFLSPKAFTNTTGQAKMGKLERKGAGGQWGEYGFSWRDFEVANVPKNEWEVFSKEFYGALNYIISDLPQGKYEIELGFCEGYCTAADSRLFNVLINGEKVLEDFDILKTAGGPHLAVVKKFSVCPQKGKIEINFAFGKINAPSISRLRIYNEKGEMIVEDTALKNGRAALGWLPLAKKGRCYRFGDWLYHKECVAKAHPVFDGLQAKGIMDWDYYGPVISSWLFEVEENPDEVIAAAFAAGYACPGGYASGIMMASYPFLKGRFLVNTFNVLDQIDKHPAADRLLLNMINYASSYAGKPTSALPKTFDRTLKAIGYIEE